MTDISPSDEWVLIAPEKLEGERKTKGGVLVPETARRGPPKGTILAVGPGRLDGDGNRIPLPYKPGDVVLFLLFQTVDVEFEDEDRVVLVKAPNIIATLDAKQ